MMDLEDYERLQRERKDVVLLIARHVASDDLSVERRLEAWAQCACRKHWDALLIEVSDVLPEYRAERSFNANDHLVVGKEFRVCLPELEEINA